MAESKRYYWLKLQDDFFKSKRIKKLRRIAGGDTYTIIYLKMQLLAMKSGGVLEYTGLEQSFSDELALDLDEEPENVAVTVNFLLSCGLLETSDDKEYFVPYAVLNTGSEGASAKRVREHREKKALHCNTDVTPVKQICNGEKEIEKELVEIKWDAEAAEKGGYEHFMMKEIHEQPKAIADTLNSVLKDGKLDLSAVELSDEEIKKISQIYIVACGSAYHVGVVAQYVMEDLAKIPVRVELASEFRYRKPLLDPDGLVIVISQSGETADSLAALRLAKDKGLRTLGIVNVVGSSIAREADNVFYTLAGPEISVATTKAYSTQLIAAYCLAIQFARVRGEITDDVYSTYLEELKTIPDKIEKILEDKERIQWFAAKVANSKDIFFIGRGIDYAVSLEGSLKLKEISYIHSEAYAAGELKHGTISLIEDNILVIGVLTQSELYEKTISNMVECKSRGAYLMGLTTYGKYEVEDTVEFTVYIPKIDEHFAASLAVVPLQLLGYYVSVAKGLDVDKPRNLAKSVTVE